LEDRWISNTISVNENMSNFVWLCVHCRGLICEVFSRIHEFLDGVSDSVLAGRKTVVMNVSILSMMIISVERPAWEEVSPRSLMRECRDLKLCVSLRLFCVV
jgi:hypothetical protein